MENDGSTITVCNDCCSPCRLNALIHTLGHGPADQTYVGTSTNPALKVKYYIQFDFWDLGKSKCFTGFGKQMKIKRLCLDLKG